MGKPINEINLETLLNLVVLESNRGYLLEWKLNTDYFTDFEVRVAKRQELMQSQAQLAGYKQQLFDAVLGPLKSPATEPNKPAGVVGRKPKTRSV